MRAEELDSYIEKVPLFSTLSAREISVLKSVMIAREFEEGQTIVHQEDDSPPTFFIIASGTVQVTVITSEGKQAILATLRRGEFFGEMAILDGEPRSASVIAAQKCLLLMLYRDPFLDILEKLPKLTIRMLVEMSRRLRHTNRQINTLSMMSVFGRVADVIMQLARENGKKIGQMIIIENRPTHQDIADMAGTSRETVSRVISQLQKKQYLTIDRKKMVILNEEKLYY